MTIREDAIEVMNRLTKEIRGRRSMSHFVKDDPETKLYADALNTIGFLISPPEPTEVQRLVDEQARDEGLWFQAQTCAEAYVQTALRKLHAAVEGDKSVIFPARAMPLQERAAEKSKSDWFPYPVKPEDV